MKKYWIWISNIKGIGSVTARKLLDYFITPENIFHAQKRELLEVKDVGEVTAERIINSRVLSSAEKILGECHKHDIKVLTIEDSFYPDIAKNISTMPVVLYYRGHLKQKSIGIGIVGTRRCTEYGKRAAVEASEFLAKKNVPVISGMAKGIDSYAHTSCITSGGYTIAVLGNGLDICYPNEHENLMEKIIENGCIISEYPPGTKPLAAHFPERNRIIAAWSNKLLVVEAGEKSGALITAEYAKKFGRKIFAVPSGIYSKEGIGTNKLLQSGAEIYFLPNQLLEGQTNESVCKPKDKAAHIHVLEHHALLEDKIIKELIGQNLTLDELMIIFKDHKHRLVETISMMEVEGKIRSKIGGKLSLP